MKPNFKVFGNTKRFQIYPSVFISWWFHTLFWRFQALKEISLGVVCLFQNSDLKVGILWKTPGSIASPNTAQLPTFPPLTSPNHYTFCQSMGLTNASVRDGGRRGPQWSPTAWHSSGESSGQNQCFSALPWKPNKESSLCINISDKITQSIPLGETRVI